MDEKKLPRRIKQCPISESIFELRFKTLLPTDAILGTLYNLETITKFFPKKNVISLPILNLPEEIRKSDPNLQYKVYYRFTNQDLTMSIGPRVIAFSNVNNYIGWDKWSSFFIEILEDIFKLELVNRVERLGLRYINVFENTIILDKLKLNMSIEGEALAGYPTNIRTEIPDNGITKVLNINNFVTVKSEKRSAQRSSVIDIDCLKE